jgi:hypothetical protein
MNWIIAFALNPGEFEKFVIPLSLLLISQHYIYRHICIVSNDLSEFNYYSYKSLETND